MSAATLFRGGHVVDVAAGESGLADLLVRDGTIVAVGETEADGASIVDVSGRWLMPGLISLHVHPGVMSDLRNDHNALDEARFRRDLAVWPRYGVTTVQSLGLDRPFAFDVASKRADGEARLLTAGHGFGVAGGVPPFHIDPPGPLRETDLGTLRRALEDLRARGASGVKLWYDDWYGQHPKMTDEVARTIIETSAELGLRSYAHVYRVDDAKVLIEMGLRTLAHMPRDREADDELWSLMKERDVAVVPTLTVPDTNVVYLDRPAFLDDPVFLASVGRTARDRLASDDYLDGIRARKEFPRYRQDLADALANVAGAYRAGVRFGFGTDAGVSQRVVGFAEHRELALLVDAGVRPAGAIRMATRDSAEILGRDDLGELAPGRAADIVVLAADPLADVRALRTIESVWIGGARVAGSIT